MSSEPHYLDTGAVVVDHIEDVDQAEEDGYQETHPPGHNIGRDDERGPGDQDDEAGGDVVDDEVFLILTADVDIEPREREVTKFSIIVQIQAEDSSVYKKTVGLLPSGPIIVVVIVAVRGIPEGDVVIEIGVLFVNSETPYCRYSLKFPLRYTWSRRCCRCGR